MSWYSDEFRYRIPVTVYNSSGSATIDVSDTLPQDLDHFWDTIDSSGEELRLTDSNGYSLLDYNIGGFSKASRTATVEIDALSTVATEGVHLVWLYYGTDGAQGDASTAVTITSAESFFVDRARPGHPRVALSLPPAGRTRPRAVVGKTTSTGTYINVDVTGLLEHRGRSYAASVLYEEPRTVVVDVYNSGGASQAAMFDLGKQRFVEVADARGRRLFVRCWVEAGSDATNYALQLEMTTAVPVQSGTYRTLEERVGVRVNDSLEAA